MPGRTSETPCPVALIWKCLRLGEAFDANCWVAFRCGSSCCTPMNSGYTQVLNPLIPDGTHRLCAGTDNQSVQPTMLKPYENAYAPVPRGRRFFNGNSGKRLPAVYCVDSIAASTVGTQGMPEGRRRWNDPGAEIDDPRKRNGRAIQESQGGRSAAGSRVPALRKVHERRDYARSRMSHAALVISWARSIVPMSRFDFPSSGPIWRPVSLKMASAT